MRIGTIHRSILRIALPAIISNVTVPLLGMVDTAIVGHLGRTSCIGAIAVGSLVFSIIYWLFGFLRASTSGLTSQALGENKEQLVAMHFYRSALLAIFIALLLLLLQEPLAWIAFRWIDASAEVEQLARTYFNVCIWGAPAVMLTKTCTGWFIGLQDTRSPMLVAIVQNLINIPISLLLVFVCGWQVEGVALGTVVAQYAGLVLALALRRIRYRQYCGRPMDISIGEMQAIGHLLAINRDIFLRTVCIVSVTAFFTAAGARQGDLVLAANTLLLQLFYFFSYIMDGFANAGEALCGRMYGARRMKALRAVVRALFVWGWGIALLFTLVYVLCGRPFLAFLTDNVAVLGVSDAYFGWILAVPLAGFAAFLWDGVFVGLTATRSMFVSMLLATVVFFFCWRLLDSGWGNHALWLSFVLYLLVRGLAQSVQFRFLISR